jgi:large subunit ribosomal protein L15
LPKRGFNNIFKPHYQVINVGRLEQAVVAGKLKAGDTITPESLIQLGMLSKLGDGVRLLAKGEIKTALTVECAGASAAAIAAIEAAGGKVVLRGKAGGETQAA